MGKNTEPISVNKTQDFREKRKLMLMVLVIVLIVSSVAFIGTYSYSSVTVNVMSISLKVYGIGTNSTVLFNENVPYNHETLYGKSIFVFGYHLKNNYSSDMTIVAYKSLTQGFGIKSTSPSFPIQIHKGESIIIEITILTPDQNYAGPLNLVLYAKL